MHERKNWPQRIACPSEVKSLPGVGSGLTELSRDIHGIDVDHAIPVARERIRIACHGLKNFKERRNDVVTVGDRFLNGGFGKATFVSFQAREDFLSVHRIPDKPTTAGQT